MEAVTGAEARRSRFLLLVAIMLGTIGWGGLALLAATMLGQHPPHAGFDLDLLFRAGRRVAAGLSPYDRSQTSGSLQAEDLFYSYPPPVAQAMAVLAPLPLSVVLAGWVTAATAAIALVAAALARRVGRPGTGTRTAIAVVAVLPFVYPYAVAALFGNLDLWLPAAYGLVALAVLAPPRETARGSALAVAGGVALGLVAVAKLQPALVILWCLVRGGTTWHRGEPVPQPGRIAAAAIATVGVAVASSLVLAGTGPWHDYLGVLRAGSGARLASSLNIGPGSQLALLAHDPSLAAPLATWTGLLATLTAAIVAWRLRDSVLSLAVAVTMSLVLLPVTWFHYPIALLPFAIVAVARASAPRDLRRVAAFLAGAAAIAAVAIVDPVLSWLAVGFVVVAVAVARSTPGRDVDRSRVQTAAPGSRP
ncbi:MAG TPA: glycosyltransferase family 87 protein [Trebonia sp.]